MYSGPGRYEHYKGGKYRVLGVGVNKETNRRYVVYEPLNIDQSIIGDDDFFLRPLSQADWQEGWNCQV